MKLLSGLVKLQTKQVNTPLQQCSSQNKNLIFTFQIKTYSISKMEQRIQGVTETEQGKQINSYCFSTQTRDCQAATQDNMKTGKLFSLQTGRQVLSISKHSFYYSPWN